MIEKFADENNIKINVWIKKIISSSKKLGRPFGAKSRELKLEHNKKRLEWM